MSATPSEWNPDGIDVAHEVALNGLPGWIMAAITLLGFLIFFVIRCASCNHDPKGRDDWSRINSTSRECSNFFAAVLLVSTIFAGTLIIYTAFSTGEELDQGANAITDEVDRYYTAVNNSVSIMHSGPDDVAPSVAELAVARATLSQIQRDSRDWVDKIRDVFSMLRAVLVTTGFSAIVCAGLGLLCLWLQKTPWLYAFFVSAMVMVVVQWVMVGGGLVWREGITGTCEVAKAHVNGVPSEWILELVHCDAIMEIGGSAAEEAMLGANWFAQAANAELQRVNNLLDVNGSPMADLEMVCEPFVEDLSVEGGYIANNATGNCTQLERRALSDTYGPAVCSDEFSIDGNSSDSTLLACIATAAPIPPATYDTLVSFSDSVRNLTHRLIPTLEQLESCAYLDSAIERIADDSCDVLDMLSVALCVATFIAAISLTATSLYFCACTRNVQKIPADPELLAVGSYSHLIYTSSSYRSDSQDKLSTRTPTYVPP